MNNKMFDNYQSSHLHPVENALALDGKLRYIFQNPKKILSKHIKPGMTVLDLGCGTGFFTIEIAKLLREKGKVIASDVQKGMLDILRKKLVNNELDKLIQIHNNEENYIGISEKIDFILAFYSLHEVKYLDRIICELTGVFKPETKILISEQKYHVSKSNFDFIIKRMEKHRFKICEKPRIFLSRAVVMRHYP